LLIDSDFLYTINMSKIDATQFWLRYNELTGKDLPVILSTGIKQSTLSSWRTKKIFPIADEAYLLAEAIDTTVEYLVSGRDKLDSAYPKPVVQIAGIADKLSDQGLEILSVLALSLLGKYPKGLSR